MRQRTTVFDVLAAGIPISLLLDLARPGGPDSSAILMWEQHGPTR